MNDPKILCVVCHSVEASPYNPFCDQCQALLQGTQAPKREGEN